MGLWRGAKGQGTLLRKMATLPCSVSFSFLLLSSLVPLPPKQPCRGQYPFHHNPSLKSVLRLLGAACLHWQTDSYGLERLPQETQKSHPPAKYLSLFVALTDIWGNFKWECETVFGIPLLCWQWVPKMTLRGFSYHKKESQRMKW